MIIPKPVQKALRLLEAEGFDAYVVGGCVRDSLLGLTPADWDITTSAPPNTVCDIFSDFSVIPTGIKHGTVTVIIHKTPIEITTFRIDGSYSDNRHPKSVTFSSSITEDLRRRDFTINAMAYSPKSGLVDPFGGINDLKNRIIRAVGSPEKRFSEDALRIMRGLRFSAVLGFALEEETEKAIFHSAPLLEHIAAERITAEFNKLLLSPNAAEITEKYFSVLSLPLFGEVCQSSLPSQVFAPLSAPTSGLSAKLTVFLICAARLTETSPENTADVFFSVMRYDSKTKKSCLSILNNLSNHPLSGIIPLRFLVRDLGFENANAVIEVRLALAKTSEEFERLKKAEKLLLSIIENKDCCRIRDLNIDGKILSCETSLRGTEIGKALDFLLEEVIAERCKNQPGPLLKHLHKNIKNI